MEIKLKRFDKGKEDTRWLHSPFGLDGRPPIRYTLEDMS